MRRIVVSILAVMLLVTTVLPSLSSASAASKNKIIYIVNIDNEGVRVRSTPRGGDTDNVMTTLRKGTKLFYLGQSGSWYKVCSEFGPTSGYVYKGYTSYYGAVALHNIFKCSTDARMYSGPSTSSKRVTNLKKDQFVIVYAVSGKWAYVHTISGKRGYVRTSQLEDID